MRIKGFNSFLYERLGIADSTLFYSELLVDFVKKHFDLFQNDSQVKFEFQEKIKDLDAKEDFPVSEIILDISLERVPHDTFFTKYKSVAIKNKHFTTTGLCFNIGEEDGSEILDDDTIKLRIGVGVIIDDDLFVDLDRELLLIEVESSLTHELNHSFENYRRFCKEKTIISAELTYALDDNAADVPREVWIEWWRRLGYYIYWTESHEINAMKQDSFPYVKRFELEEMKQKNPSWDFYLKMSMFKASEFKSDMIEKIKKNIPDSDPIKVLIDMKDGLANKLSEMTEDRNKPSIPPKLIKRLSIDGFLDYCENRIQKGAEKLRRGILRQYSR